MPGWCWWAVGCHQSVLPHCFSAALEEQPCLFCCMVWQNRKRTGSVRMEPSLLQGSSFFSWFLGAYLRIWYELQCSASSDKGSSVRTVDLLALLRNTHHSQSKSCVNGVNEQWDSCFHWCLCEKAFRVMEMWHPWWKCSFTKFSCLCQVLLCFGSCLGSTCAFGEAAQGLWDSLGHWVWGLEAHH